MISNHKKREYEQYIQSPQWKKKREKALKAAKFKGEYWCQGCGWNFPKEQLEVHHRHYRTLGRERLIDLLVVCKRCHDKYDLIRKREGEKRADEALYQAQLDGWATKRLGEDWYEHHDVDHITEMFEEWLERKGEW